MKIKNPNYTLILDEEFAGKKVNLLKIHKSDRSNIVIDLDERCACGNGCAACNQLGLSVSTELQDLEFSL